MFDLEDIASLHMESYFESPYEFNGHPVPRVTEIIGKMIEEPSIAQWANSLGFKHQSYRKTLEEFATLGSRTHHAIELFLNGQEIPPETPQFTMDSFKLWWMEMQKLNVRVLGTENALACEWYGGTYDMMMNLNGKIYLVDFKTSNHVTYKYWLQLAAYSKILREQHGIKLDGCLILQLSKYAVAFREYVLDLSWQPHVEYFEICERTFMNLMYGYYHILYLERRFKDEWPTLNPREFSQIQRPSSPFETNS